MPSTTQTKRRNRNICLSVGLGFLVALVYFAFLCLLLIFSEYWVPILIITACSSLIVMIFVSIYFYYDIQKKQRKHSSSQQIQETDRFIESSGTELTQQQLSQNTSSSFKQVRKEGLLNTLKSWVPLCLRIS